MRYNSLEDYKSIPSLPRMSEQHAHAFFKASFLFILSSPTKKKQIEILNLFEKHLKNKSFTPFYIQGFKWKEDKNVLTFGIELLERLTYLGFDTNLLFPNARYEAYLNGAPFTIHQKLDELEIPEIESKDFNRLIRKSFEKEVHYEVAKSPILDSTFLKMFEKRGLNKKYLKQFPIKELGEIFSKNYHWFLFKNEKDKYVKSLYGINFGDGNDILNILAKNEVDWFRHLPNPQDYKEDLIIQIGKEFKQKFQETLLKKTLTKQIATPTSKNRF